MICVVADVYDFIKRMREDKTKVKLADYVKYTKGKTGKGISWIRIAPTERLVEEGDFDIAYEFIDCVSYGGQTFIISLDEDGETCLIFQFDGDCDLSLFCKILLNVFKEDY